MKFAKVAGKGSVTFSASGDRSNLDISGDITVKMA